MTEMRSRLSSLLPNVELTTLYLMVFTLPLQALAVVPGIQITVTKICGALLIASLILRHAISRELPFKRTGLETGIFLFAFSCLLSLFTSIDRAGSVNALITLTIYAVLVYAVAEITASKEIQHRVVTVFVLSAALSGLGALFTALGLAYSYVVDIHLELQDVQRIAFGLTDANEQALLLLFALCFLAFYKGLWKGHANCIFSVVALFLAVSGVLLTMSRTAWICGLALAAVRMAMSKRRLRLFASATVVSCAVLLILSVIQPRLLGDIQRRTLAALTLEDSSETHRVYQYLAVAERASERGILGYGLDTRDEVSATLYYRSGMPMEGTVHSVPLIFLLELGWPGLLGYLLLWSCLLVVLRDAYRRAEPESEQTLLLAYGALFACLGVFSMVMPFIYRSSFPILIGCALGASRMVGHHLSDSPNDETRIALADEGTH